MWEESFTGHHQPIHNEKKRLQEENDGFTSEPPTPPQSTNSRRSQRKRGRDETVSGKPPKPKRISYRAKVAKDGIYYGVKKTAKKAATPKAKPKMSPRATTTPKPSTPNQNPSSKRRKYARKKQKTGGEENHIQEEMLNKEDLNSVDNKSSSCRRSLNFDNVETQMNNNFPQDEAVIARSNESEAVVVAASQEENFENVDIEPHVERESSQPNFIYQYWERPKIIYQYQRRNKRQFSLKSSCILGSTKLPWKKRRTKTRRAKTSLELVSPSKDQLRAALMDPERFRCVINLGMSLKSKINVGVPLKSKIRRRQRTTRRRRPSYPEFSLTLTQLPSAPPVETSIVNNLDLNLETNEFCMGQSTVNCDLNKESLFDLDLNNENFLDLDLNKEDFLDLDLNKEDFLDEEQPAIDLKCELDDWKKMMRVPVKAASCALIEKNVFSAVLRDDFNESQMCPPQEPKASLDQGAIGSLRKLLISSLSERLGSICISKGLQQKKGNGLEIVPIKSNQRIAQYNSKAFKPKVNLDLETLRVWDLWMKDEEKEEGDGIDKEFWKREREKYASLIQPFINCMRETLGNRRFSPWKGSVTDSLIGVFLTQNVGDHSSSNAFMDLAADFPRRSGSKNIEYLEYTEKCCPELEEETSYIKEQQINKTGCFHVQILSEEETDSIEEQQMQDDGNSSPPPVIVENLEEAAAVYAGNTQDGEKGNLEFNLDESFEKRDDHVHGCADNNNILKPAEAAAVYAGNTQVGERGNLEFNPDESFEKRDDQVHGCADNNNILKQVEANECIGKKQNLESLTYGLEEQVARTMQVEVHRAGEEETQKAEPPQRKKGKGKEKKQETPIDWDALKKNHWIGRKSHESLDTMDRVDYEAIRRATVDDVANTISLRGMSKLLARNIKEFIDRMVREHGSTDLEWIRDIPSQKAKEFLLSIAGIGLKSAECVRLLTLHHRAFPVDTNVNRIAVRLGWVPLQPLPEKLPLHDLVEYPDTDSVQKYLWTRIKDLDHETLYELHYAMISFGKVICTKLKPRCSECHMKDSCKYYASVNGRPALPEPKGKSPVDPDNTNFTNAGHQTQGKGPVDPDYTRSSVPMMPVPNTNFTNPSHQNQNFLDVEDAIQQPHPLRVVGNINEPYTCESDDDDDDLIPSQSSTDVPNMDVDQCMENCTSSLVEYNGPNRALNLVVVDKENASVPSYMKKTAFELRTRHTVYELPDDHPVLRELNLDPREPDDLCKYLLAVWPTDENAETIPSTLLIPCRTANKGSFPLNGTYFQVNEVFVDDETSEVPIEVPREWLSDLGDCKRYLYCGTSTSNIFKVCRIEEIKMVFDEGYICVRAFDRRSLRPRPLPEKFHVGTASQAKKKKELKLLKAA